MGERTELAFEGCLSIPGLRGRVPRHASVAYRALDRHGAEVSGVAEACSPGYCSTRWITSTASSIRCG